MGASSVPCTEPFGGAGIFPRTFVHGPSLLDNAPIVWIAHGVSLLGCLFRSYSQRMPWFRDSAEPLNKWPFQAKTDRVDAPLIILTLAPSIPILQLLVEAGSGCSTEQRMKRRRRQRRKRRRRRPGRTDSDLVPEHIVEELGLVASMY